jgi:hypothetical protein
MRKSRAYLVLLIVAALAGVVVARQRTLNHLRAENALLRKRVELKESARRLAVRGTQSSPLAGLSQAQKAELLRLRGSIAPLLQQLRDSSNRVVVLKRFASH